MLLSVYYILGIEKRATIVLERRKEGLVYEKNYCDRL